MHKRAKKAPARSTIIAKRNAEISDSTECRNSYAWIFLSIIKLIRRNKDNTEKPDVINKDGSLNFVFRKIKRRNRELAMLIAIEGMFVLPNICFTNGLNMETEVKYIINVEIMAVIVHLISV